MNTFARKLWTFILILMSCTASSKEWIHQVPNLDSNPYVQTVLGSRARSLQFQNTPAYAIKKVFHPDFNQPLSVLVSENTKKDKSPLMIVFSTLYGNADGDALDQLVLKLYRSLGYHVLILPASFSDSYSSSHPAYPPSSILEEVRIAYDLVQTTIHLGYLQKNKIDSVSILGMSYGGFLASVFAKLVDQFHFANGGTTNFISGSITLVSPIAVLRGAQDTIDEIIRYSEEKCNNHWANILAAAVSNLSEANAKCLIGKRFLENLVNMVINIRLSSGPVIDLMERTDYISENLRFVPKEKDGAEAERFQMGFGYRKAMTLYTGSDLLWGDPILGKLMYWINSMPEIYQNKTWLITSLDDFLFDKDQSFALPNEQIKFLVHGGHLGFMHTEWFRQITMAIRNGEKKLYD